MKGVRGALLRYRIMAYVVGTLLIILTVGVVIKYTTGSDTLVAVAGTIHGFLYMLLIVTAFDLLLRVRWPITRLLLIALAGTVPFLSFVAERSVTKSVRAWLADHAAKADFPGQPEPAPAPVKLPEDA